MRKITLTLFAMVVFVAAYCGVPQAISYQAVVQNATSGQPIKDKTVSVRLSILSGSAVGPVSFEETQSITTDGIGVIALNIGNGSVVSGTFTSINWSSGSYYLKTEIDTTGGTNYANVGTVEFFSVPYAMYAAQSNFASSDFPDGLVNIVPILQNGSFSYTVPAGQTLYITNISYNQGASCTSYGVNVNGVTLTSNETTGGTSASASNKIAYPIGIPSGYNVSSSSCGTSMLGFTIPTNNSWVAFDLSSGNYTVPVGKVLVVNNMVSNASATWNNTYNISGNTTTFEKGINFIDQSQTISANGLSGGSLMMIGYLKNR